MAPQKHAQPVRTPFAPTTSRPATKKGTATVPAPARSPFPTKITVPVKMKHGPKATKSK